MIFCKVNGSPYTQQPVDKILYRIFNLYISGGVGGAPDNCQVNAPVVLLQPFYQRMFVLSVCFSYSSPKQIAHNSFFKIPLGHRDKHSYA